METRKCMPTSHSLLGGEFPGSPGSPGRRAFHYEKLRSRGTFFYEGPSMGKIRISPPLSKKVVYRHIKN